MRLIDADALVSALNNGRLKEQTGRAVPFNAGVAFALTMVEYAPTIDAVPVVRCRDCKHCDPEDKRCDCGHAILWQLPRDDDWFCADGEWRDDEGFQNFYEWAMANGYRDELTIDRIDVNGNYSPNNCRWITQYEQTRNRRNTINITALGKTMCLKDWIDECGNHVHYLYWHKGEDALVEWLEATVRR